jgi:hypothetical protein
MSDMETQLRALLDKEAIRELVQIYCRAADRHDHALMRSLYHEDAYDDHGSFFKGSAMEFIDMLPEIQKPMAILHHNVTTHNIMLDADNPDYAEGETYLIAFHKVKADEETPGFDVLVGGRYFDKYERRDGVWKFLSRSIDADWVYVSDPSAVNLDHPMIDGVHIGKPGTADPSYELLKMFKPGARETN